MTTAVDAVEPAVLIGLVVTWIALALVVYAWLALALSVVFRKAGVESWRAWVPVMNLFALLELGGFSGWIALAVLVPFGGIVVWVFVVLAAHRIGRSFGYGGAMTVVAAVLLPVWASVIGFGPARWLGRLPGHRSAPPDLDDPGLTRRAVRLAAASGAAGAPQNGGLRGSGAPLPPAPPVPSAPAAAVARERAATAATGGIPIPGSSPSTTGPAFAPAATGWPAVPALATPMPPYQPPSEPGSAGPWSPVGDATPPAAGPVRTPSAPDTAPAPAEDWSRRARRELAQPATPATGPTPPIDTVPAPSDAVPALHHPRYPEWEPDEIDDLPDEVSAAHTIPAAAEPRSARSSVSWQHANAEPPEDEETIVVVRRRAAWELVLPLGPPVAIAGRTVILGRRPAPDAEYPDAQLVPIVDETRTVSKRHARLELRDDGWWIIDLHSTNGVVLATADGAEQELEPGVEHLAGDRFLLGDAEVRLQRGAAG